MCIGSMTHAFLKSSREDSSIEAADALIARFIWSMWNPVHLVEHARLHREHGSSMSTNSQGQPRAIFSGNSFSILEKQIKLSLIGDRQEKKKDKALVSVEEIAGAEDLDDYFGMPRYYRDLDYETHLGHGEGGVLSKAMPYAASSKKQRTIHELANRISSLQGVSEV